MQEADIEKIARITKEAGLLLIVDNTFYTFFQCPPPALTGLSVFQQIPLSYFPLFWSVNSLHHYERSRPAFNCG
jgi:hypothetical protein